MAITTDIIKIEGNSLYIRSNPTIGLLGITSFVDNAAGETGSVYFTKSFRYSINGGIDWSSWAPLTTPNLTTLVFNGSETVVFEMQYEKVQPPGVDQLTVSQVTFTEDGTIDPPATPYFQNSIFAEFFGAYDIEVMRWYLNVLNKLYEKGLVADYIERKNDAESNEDYLAFWTSIAQFFAFLVIYARKFQNFYESETLLAEFLTERGMQISPENDLAEMNYLLENFYKEVARRGTVHIIDKIEASDIIDGELLRLIHYKADRDEILFNLYKPEHFGWNLGNSSPLHRSLYLNDNINKSYETGFDVKDISKYPTMGDVTVVTDGDKSVMRIGPDSAFGNGNTKFIKVDARLDYEFSFMIKKTRGKNLRVGVYSFDKDHNVVASYSHKDGTVTNLALIDVDLSRDDKYLLVRVILYNKNKTPQAADTTEINQGTDLIFDPATVYIIPTIGTGEDATAYVWGIRIMPIATPYSRGLLQVDNFISAWLRNRNHQYTLSEIKEWIKRYLIPLNAHIEITDDGDSGYDGSESEEPTFSWIPGGEYCETLSWRPIDPVCETKTYSWEPEEETAYCETTEGQPGPTA